MLRVTLKGLLAHKVRFVLTALAVVIGVSFVAGSFILTDSIDDAFTGLFEETSAGTDLFVRPAAAVEEDVTQSWVSGREPLPASIVEEVRAVDGVATATGWVEGFAQIVGPDGEPVGGQGPPVLGFSWDEAGPLALREGREPQAAGEVVIDAVTVQTTGYALGDEVTVITVAGSQRFALVGVAGFGESDNLLGASIAAFELEEARRLFDKEGRFDQLAVTAEPGVALDVLRDRVQAVVSDGVQVVTAQTANEEGMEDIEGFLSILNSALPGFAFVAMFVGAFIIANTFSIVVAQRTREFALLRAVGASAVQVKRAVRGEALVVGVVASAVGLLVGIGFARGLTLVLDAFGLGIPTGATIVAPRTVVWSFVVGIGVTLVAAYLPARRAASVAPVEAMRGVSGDERGLGRRTTVGSVVAVFGLALFGLGAFGGIGNAAILVGVGALAILLGVATMSPALAGPIAAIVGAGPARLGTAGKLAQGNAARDRRRTAVTASALMVGLALVTFATIFAASATQSASASIDEQFTADLSLGTNQPAVIGLPPVVADDLDTRDEFATVSRVRLATFRADGRGTSIAGVEPSEVGDVVGLGEVTGDLAELLDGPAVFVHDELLAAEGWRIGQSIPVAFSRTGEHEFRIAGTYEHPEILGAPVMTALGTFDQHVVSPQDAFVFLRLAEGVSPEEARGVLDEALSGYPNVEVYDSADLRQLIEDGVNQVLGLMTVMLALAIVVALLGITNTLALAVFERTREIGLLRAVGMTRGQVKAMIRWESTIVAVFGAVMGVAVGTLFGWALVRALEDEGFNSLVVPGSRLVLYVVAAAFAGVVAAAFPARRAAKLDVLEAVTIE